MTFQINFANAANVNKAGDKPIPNLKPQFRVQFKSNASASNANANTNYDPSLEDEMRAYDIEQDTLHKPKPLIPPQTRVVSLKPRLRKDGQYYTKKGDLLDEDQTAAVHGVLVNKYSCVVGKAGTGKTTTENALLAELEDTLPLFNRAELESKQITAEDVIDGNYEPPEDDFHVAACLCAFMGRAVQQMRRNVDKKYHSLCNTIHKTLAYKPVYHDRWNPKKNKYESVRVFEPTFDENNPLPYKICVIDEGGTCPVFLFNNLMRALPDDCRIIIIGDINQLPPVSGRSILGYAMLKWPTFGLTKLHRNAGPIAINANRILEGKLPLPDPQNGVHVINISDSKMKAFTQGIGVVQKMHQVGKFNPESDGFIVPTNVGELGQVQLNENLVRYFNPPKQVEGVVVNPRTVITAGYQHVMFAVGDKVMLLKNLNHLGLTNGMMGVVTEINLNHAYTGDTIGAMGDHSPVNNNTGNINLDDLDSAFKAAEEETDEEESPAERQASHIMRVRFFDLEGDEEETTIAFTTAGEYSILAHSYAFTCHKSQGSEFPTVVVLMHSAYRRMLCREWFYTAFTRAQKEIVILANERALTHAVGMQRIKGNTWQEKAKSFNQLMENGQEKGNGKNGKNGNNKPKSKYYDNNPSLPKPVTYELDELQTYVGE